MNKKKIIHGFGFDIVHGCQLRCVGCPNSTLKPKIKFVSLEDFEICLGHVDVDMIRIFRLFNFGEALLHPDVPGLLRLIPKFNFNVGVVEVSTNAQHHNFPMLEEMFKTGVLDSLVVSCDGNGLPEEYERLRPPAKWEKLIEFLKKASEYKKKNGLDINLITRTICESEEGRRRWLDLLEPMGWKPRFRNWMNYPEAKEHRSSTILKVKNKACIYLELPTLYVDYDGTVIPCCFHPKARVLGNLKAKRYSEIENGAKRKEFIQELKRDRINNPICGQCEVRSLKWYKMKKNVNNIINSMGLNGYKNWILSHLKKRKHIPDFPVL